MPAPTSSQIKAAILDRAHALGFVSAGVTTAEAIAAAGPRLDRFLELGRHGEMSWMAERAAQRRSPTALWPEARSVVMLAADYGPPDDPMDLLAAKDRALISVYARNKDYHDVLKKRLKQLGRWLADSYAAQVKVFVDTAPVMEKPLAEAAGLGWQGKHTNLVSRDYGSWLFLGALFTNLVLPPDAREADHCGSCRRCLDICPTDAFPAPYQLDARRCLSYLTIEHKGPIPEEFRAAMGNRIYGCDDCLAVCPWNKFARIASDAHFHARVELQAPELADLAALDEAGFRQLFAGSPIKRIGRDRFVRNVCIAIGNSGKPDLKPVVETLTDDASDVVRDAAGWALAQLRAA
ncbi:MAG: tRNA epoxyqueuosine(34) reductase QueG [Rhodothalassiaceae bacterium]